MEVFNTQNKTCALTKLPLKWATGNNSDPFNMSLDRIDNTKGYELGNVRLVLLCVNSFRMKMTDAEMLTIAKALVHNVR